MNKILLLEEDKAVIIFDRNINIENLIKVSKEKIKKFKETQLYNSATMSLIYGDRTLKEFFLNFKITGNFKSKDIEGNLSSYNFELKLENVEYYVNEINGDKGLIFSIKDTIRHFSADWDMGFFSPTDIIYSPDFKVNEAFLELPNHEYIVNVIEDFKLEIDTETFEVLLPKNKNEGLYHIPKGFQDDVYTIPSLLRGYNLDGDIVFKDNKEYYIHCLCNTIKEIKK